MRSNTQVATAASNSPSISVTVCLPGDADGDLTIVPAADLPLKGAPNAQICLLPIVAGFVGADTMACVLSTRIYESEELRALVDIGTNGEVVMGSRDRLMACSAPAGPALEGAQIRHGMRGAMGAIEDVTIDGDVHCGVIGAVPAIGICGSGLIDACAKMVTVGVMDASGKLRNNFSRGSGSQRRAGQSVSGRCRIGSRRRGRAFGVP